jgi:uncharacterized protein (TIGR02594 family)
MSILKKGARSTEVVTLQVLLNSALKPFIHLREDGDFGQKTFAAVTLFQSRHGLKADGIVGPQTWTSLGQKISRPPAITLQPPVAAGGREGWMEIAKKELNVSENHLPGQQNKRIIEYHSTTSLKATTDETAWCSSFVNWVMIQAGYQGTNSAAAKSWLHWGSSLNNGREGAITVIKKKSGHSDAATGSSTGHHVAFFVSATPTHVRLLGGNQSDQVKYSNFLLASYEIKGYRWPS